MMRTRYLVVGLFACQSAAKAPASNTDGAAHPQTVTVTPNAPATVPVLERAAEPPRAPAVLDAIPVASNESLIVSVPMARPPATAVTINHPGYCHLGYP